MSAWWQQPCPCSSQQIRLVAVGLACKFPCQRRLVAQYLDSAWEAHEYGCLELHHHSQPAPAEDRGE